MSLLNHLDQKRLRRVLRREQKQSAAEVIPHLGIRVSRVDVRSHRYLAAHGLPFSDTLAAVQISKVSRLNA